MQITEQQLLHVMPNARRNAGVFVSAINAMSQRWQINAHKRMAAFLAQIGTNPGSCATCMSWVRERGTARKGDRFIFPPKPLATPSETSLTLNEKALHLQGFWYLERAKGIEPSS